MTTKVYGASDDLIEFEGDIYGEVGYYTATSSQDASALVICSDGTLLTVRYGKADQGIWCLTPVAAGPLFDRIEPCESEDADIYSDIAHFREGLKWAYVATDWERVK